MPLDKELYRRAYAAIGQWKEAERIEQLQHASRLSPREAWQRYVDLIEFGWQLCPQQSEWQRVHKSADLARYYERVQKLETWRRGRARSS